MFTINQQPVSSLTNEELLRQMRALMYGGHTPPLAWIDELLRRFERKIDKEPDVTDVDPKQMAFDFEAK